MAMLRRVMTERLTIPEVDEMLDRFYKASGQSMTVAAIYGLLNVLRMDLESHVTGGEAPGQVRRPSERINKAPPSNHLFYGLSLPDAVFKQLRLAGEPQTPTRIWAALEAAGFQTAHSSPVNAVTNALKKRAKRHADVLVVGRGEWALKSNYTEEELAAIESSLGPMASRDSATHSEKTKEGMRRARDNGVCVTKERKIDVAKAEEMIRAGKSVEDIMKAFNLKARQSVYNYFSGREIWEMQGNDPALFRKGPRPKKTRAPAAESGGEVLEFKRKESQ